MYIKFKYAFNVVIKSCKFNSYRKNLLWNRRNVAKTFKEISSNIEDDHLQ